MLQLSSLDIIELLHMEASLFVSRLQLLLIQAAESALRGPAMLSLSRSVAIACTGCSHQARYLREVCCDTPEVPGNLSLKVEVKYLGEISFL